MASALDSLLADLGGEIVSGAAAPAAPDPSAQGAAPAPGAAVDLNALAAELGGEIVPYQPPPQEPGFFARVGESITGNQRRTPASEALPDWASMPEMNDLSWAGFLAGLGTMTTDPTETAQIIKNQFPAVNLAQDEKGNFLMQSGMDGQWYAIKPGFRMSDIPRAAGAMLAFTPAGRATTLPAAVGLNAATQAGIEATQAAAGGSVDPAAVALAGAGGGAGQILGRLVPAAITKTKELLRRAPGVLPEPAMVPPTLVNEIAQALPENVPAAVPEAPVMAPGVPAAVIPEAAPIRAAVEGMGTSERAALDDVIALAHKASGSGLGAATAKQRLLEMARIDPEAKAAAQELGFDLPFDVLSENTALKAAVGLTRSEVASAAEEGWRKSVAAAADKADELFKGLDAAFIDGTVAPGVPAQKVKDAMVSTRQELQETANDQFKSIVGEIGYTRRVHLPRLDATLAQLRNELGEDGFSKIENKLASMMRLQGGSPTYARLQREKNIVGEAIGAKGSPFSDLDTASLERLYGALADDQMTVARAVGGQPMAERLARANALVEQRKDLEKRLVNFFGLDHQGSIATKMRSAITGAAKGDTKEFNRLYAGIPPELRQEVMATALRSVIASTRGAERGNFGFSEFASLYPKLRANPEVFSRLVESLGPQAGETLRKLWIISKRITEARANVLGTGKSNQILRQSMNADGLINTIMESAAGRSVEAAASVAGMDKVGKLIAGAITNSSDDALRKMGDLFADQRFQLLAIEAALKPQPSELALRKVAMGKAFNDFLKAIEKPMPLDQRLQWLQAATQSGMNLQPESTQQ